LLSITILVLTGSRPLNAIDFVKILNLIPIFLLFSKG